MDWEPLRRTQNERSILWGSIEPLLISAEDQLEYNWKSVKTSWEMYGETIGTSLPIASGMQLDWDSMRRLENEWGML